MNPKTLCDQNTKEQLAERVVQLETEMAGIELMEAEGASFAETIVRNNTALKSKNAELKKFLKHARDDKKIRLGEIEGLEEKTVELREFIAMFEIDQLQGMFNHYMEMQKQAIHGQSGTFTINFWHERVKKQLKIIETFETIVPKETTNENPPN